MTSADHDGATVPEDEGVAPKAADVPPAFALALAFCADAPERVGEVAILTETPRILGRGGAAPEDPEPRLAFIRERGGYVEGTPPLASKHLSRVQLRVAVRPGSVVAVENLGRLPLLVRGAAVTASELLEGDVFELGTQLAFVLVRRAPLRTSRSAPEFPFGEADAHGLVGESMAAWALRDVIEFIAPRGGHVFIQGESGTGKELVAAALHARSKVARGPFVARNAATFPEPLIDAELFGHAKNYPNAGMPERAGLIGEANGGTLFLDEFAELPVPMQAHLLRVLDSGEYQRLGDSKPRQSSFRLVAATNRDASAIKHDVLARFVHRIQVPPFTARREDVPLVLQHLARRVASKDSEMARTWMDASGRARFSLSMVRTLLENQDGTNARGLDRALWGALASSKGTELELAPRDRAPKATPPRSLAPPPESEDEDGGLAPDAARIQACLDDNNGMLEATWRALGLPSRHALARLVKKHGLEVRRRPK